MDRIYAPLWSPAIGPPPPRVIKGALQRLRRQERDRWRHVRDPRVERTLQLAVGIGSGTPTRSVGFGTYVATPVTSASWTITGSNLVIVVKIGTFSVTTPPTVSAVSWSLGSGTAVQIAQVSSGTPNQRQAIWVIPAPVAGSGTYTVTLSGAGTYQITASYFTGVDQTTPGTDPWTDGANGQAASVASSVANLTANDACYGGLTCSEANNGATSASPNQLYLDTGGANTIDAVDGYALGTTQVTTVMDVPGVSDVTRAAIRLAAAAGGAGDLSASIGEPTIGSSVF